MVFMSCCQLAQGWPRRHTVRCLYRYKQNYEHGPVCARSETAVRSPKFITERALEESKGQSLVLAANGAIRPQ
jgi:hypothetical protein